MNLFYVENEGLYLFSSCKKKIVVEIPDSMMAIENIIEGLIHDIFGDKQIIIKESSLLSNR
jgi:hypothetical protein